MNKSGKYGKIKVALRYLEYPNAALSTCSWQAKSKDYSNRIILSLHPASVNVPEVILKTETPQLSFDFSTHHWDDAQQPQSDNIGLIPSYAERTKLCTKCKLAKPRSEFKQIYRNGMYYRISYCRACGVKQVQDWQVRNETRYRNGYKARYKAGPDRQVIRCLKNRGEKLGITNSITYEEWIEMKALSGNRCSYCGVSGDSFKLVAEHVFPLSLVSKNDYYSQFATNDLDNVIVACELCNFAKMDRPMIIFLGWLHKTLQ